MLRDATQGAGPPRRRDSSDGRATTAFVLAGGASLGAAQAGMIGALYRRRIEPDMIVGASAGALNAAFLATRPPTPATAVQLADVWRGLRRGTVFPLNPLAGLLGLTRRADHVVRDTELRRVVATHLEVDRLEDAPVAVHMLAVDLLNGEEVLLSRGPALDAVLASAAIPGVFPPVALDGRLLVDGGVANNTPLSHAVELGAERVYVLPTYGHPPLASPPRGALDAALRALVTLIDARLAGDVLRYRDDAEIIVLPAPALAVRPIDFSHADELIALAEAQADQLLAALATTPTDAAAAA